MDKCEIGADVQGGGDGDTSDECPREDPFGIRDLTTNKGGIGPVTNT